MIEEIVNFIAIQPSTLKDIQEHYDLSKHDLEDMLREAEISGMVMRKYEHGKELYYA